MTPLTPTEIESLRIAIAEECGWNTNGNKLWAKVGFHGRLTQYDLPPYTTSLDAIQAAAMERFNSPILAEKFEDELLNVYEESNFDKPWQLTALDWCIAFARTAKIWRYKV